MREPNFSESQLQQAVNSAYIRHIIETKGQWVFAHVPSLIDEFELGWDSGFYFPWINHIPNIDNEGCNFFIQYKLSGKLTSAGAKEWIHWNTEYFRFKIPHCTSDENNKSVDDYHQWNRLKELALNNYPTFYATNSTLSKDEIITESTQGTLLKTIPMLDVRSVVNQHKFVTFTPISEFFLMHSETEKVNKNIFSNIEEILNLQTFEYPAESNKKLLKILREMEKDNESWQNDILKIDQNIDAQLPAMFITWIKRSQIVQFMKKHININMLWFPKYTEKSKF